jgi:hypothetical protein
MGQILIQFYLGPERIALTYDPTWNSSPVVGKRWGADRSRAEKLRNLNLFWDASLWMPMRLRLNGTDLLDCGGGAHRRIEVIDGPGPKRFPEGHDQCPRAWLPVIVAARGGWFALRNAALWGEEGLMLADQGALHFRVHDPEVEVHYRLWYESPENYSTEAIGAIVSFADLVAAWEVFSQEVRTQFLAVLPELAEHEEYGPWFREGLEYLRRQRP